MQYTVYLNGKKLGTFKCARRYEENGALTPQYAKAAMKFRKAEGFPARASLEIRPETPEVAPEVIEHTYVAKVNGRTFMVLAHTAKEAKAALVTKMNKQGTYAEYLRWVMDGKKVRREQ